MYSVKQRLRPQPGQVCRDAVPLYFCRLYIVLWFVSILSTPSTVSVPFLSGAVDGVLDLETILPTRDLLMPKAAAISL